MTNLQFISLLAPALGSVVLVVLAWLHQNSRLADLRTDVDRQFDGVNRRIDAVEGSLNRKIDAVESSLNRKIDAVESSLNRKIDAVESSLNRKIDDVVSQVTTLASD